MNVLVSCLLYSLLLYRPYAPTQISTVHLSPLQSSDYLPVLSYVQLVHHILHCVIDFLHSAYLFTSPSSWRANLPDLQPAASLFDHHTIATIQSYYF